ncbi:MAG: tRNA (adenosine(37)-N6)-threonylcarbamoyltransferase complex transferase subunit TsaD [Chloroflexi bacterium]|nr:tRNA (adenosine(37)-N6)-threonylcarbamoyltransferase complex transferase subunit TsaD [Chloroflexota bacterium]
MRILGIETSCDETAAAVLSGTGPAGLLTLESSVVASQVDLHAATGGIVPEVAARAHLAVVVPVVRQALADAGCGWDDLDAVAVTAGPGLPGALVVGFNVARGIAYARGLPLIPVDHIEGHVAANWIAPAEGATAEGVMEARPPELPALALAVSGGHTELLLMEEPDADGRAPFTRLGGTRDDAAGEAFDKVARLLGLPYPGGPPISRLAATATERRTRLPRAWLRGSDDFSFSGLKTAVAQMVAAPAAPPAAEIAWAFEESVCDVLARKASRVAEREGVASLLVAGGVAANRRLRERIREEASIPVYIPPPVLCTDNGAMIAAAAFRHLDEAVAPESSIDIFSTAVRRARVVGRAAV